MTMRVLVVLISLVWIVSCTSGVKVTDVELPLTVIQQSVIGSLPSAVRDQSINGREFISDYYGGDKQKRFDPQKSPRRYYAHVIVLGDRRPYDIEIIVNVEKRVDNGRGVGHYQLFGYDESASQTLAEKIRDDLSKKRGETNIIDDFRAF